ncbi:hypothetical protein BDQ94DRAFT_142133 [Aspergillus welwitschiae]|uniref:Uncharacterized protein n=1 Tax=Aspergillus welwitschiae TaxID=1341132 RepID=A0A3F3Q4S9_9EURO|nr:hypothetical protein BDQ94DRAFT_142133 [Aspergillus welwitschiae]RDH34131.1 hypothetical protein BDQ94DRAFT_142133 [Aspergillus welwitschiae]
MHGRRGLDRGGRCHHATVPSGHSHCTYEVSTVPEGLRIYGPGNPRHKTSLKSVQQPSPSRGPLWDIRKLHQVKGLEAPNRIKVLVLGGVLCSTRGCED